MVRQGRSRARVPSPRLRRTPVLLALSLALAGPAAAQGDYQFDFIAAHPETYDHATGEGGQYGAREVGTTVVEQLEGGDFNCGDMVVFFLQIVAPDGIAAETLRIDFRWDAEPTGRPGAGYTDLVEAEPNTGDTGMSTNGNEVVAITSETVNGTLDASVSITNLEANEVFILRLEVQVTCIPDSSPTGNLQARLDGAEVLAPTPRSLSTGAQTVPMIGVPTPAEDEGDDGDDEEDDDDPPGGPFPRGGISTGAGGTAARGGGLPWLAAGLALLLLPAAVRSARGKHAPRRAGRTLWVIEASLLATAVAAPLLVSATPSAPAPVGPPSWSAPVPDGRDFPIARRARGVDHARPTRIRIPSIGVDARVIELGLNADGTLEVPRDFSRAGWWSRGTVPGDAGPAVIVGHVDSVDGPAVFYRLRELERGDVILVEDRRGTVVRFLVDRSEQVPKDDFPTRRVYGPTARPTLRLVTCGGAFDRSSRHYLDNLIVYARLVTQI